VGKIFCVGGIIQEEQMSTRYEDVVARCNACRWWHPAGGANAGDHSTNGECRRHAPRSLYVSDDEEPRGRYVDWALVEGSDWCGDWRSVGEHEGPGGWSYVGTGRFAGWGERDE